jgi:hypothetical protein
VLFKPLDSKLEISGNCIAHWIFVHFLSGLGVLRCVLFLLKLENHLVCSFCALFDPSDIESDLFANLIELLLLLLELPLDKFDA